MDCSTPGSSQARAQYLYEQKGIPLPDPERDRAISRGRGASGSPRNPHSPVELADLSTRSSVIESYMEDGSPYADRLHDLSKYMEIDWLMSALKGLIDHAALDGRLHSLVTTATESGRRASSYPHMQNWKMPAMAGVAIGDEGFTLVEIDYSNAENVMAAYIAATATSPPPAPPKISTARWRQQYFGSDWEIADAARAQAPAQSRQEDHLRDGLRHGRGTLGAEHRRQHGRGAAADARQGRRLRQRDAGARKRQAPDARNGGILKLWTGRKVAVPTAFVAWNYLCQGGVSEVLKRAIVPGFGRISGARHALAGGARHARRADP